MKKNWNISRGAPAESREKRRMMTSAEVDIYEKNLT
jgi:hypothetical protein